MTTSRLDQAMAILAFIVFAGFLGILFGYVTRWDLGIMVGITLALCGWDFWHMATGRKATITDRFCQISDIGYRLIQDAPGI